MANCKNTQQLNITCGTDVVLHDKLIFEEETFDPALSVDIECNLVNSLGKRTSLEYEIADEELVIQVPWVDGRNAGCYGLEVKGVCNGKRWTTYADSLIRYTRATTEGLVEVTVESDYYDVKQVVGYVYSDSPISKVTASVDDQVGIPDVDVTYANRKLNFAFHNMKGIQGIIGPVGPQGASAVFDPETGNILATLENTTGVSDSNAMTQKAVTNELYDEITLAALKNVTGLKIDTDTNKITTVSTQDCLYTRVSAGDIIRIQVSIGSNVFIRAGFSEEIPSDNVSVLSVKQFNTVSKDDVYIIDELLISPIDGYLIVNHSNQYTVTDSATLMQSKIEADDKIDSLVAYTGESGCINYISGTNPSSASGYATDYIDVEGLEYLTYGRAIHPNQSTEIGMAFYDSSKNYLCGQKLLYVEGHEGYVTTKLIVPNNAKYARFTYYPATPGFFVKIPTNKVFEQKTKLLKLVRNNIRISNGGIASAYYGKRVYSTPRYLQCQNSFAIKSSAGYATIFYYDKNYSYLGNGGNKELTANSFNDFGIVRGTEFIKIQLANDSTGETDFSGIPYLEIRGNIGDEVYNLLPSDSGYCKMPVPVQITDPNSCDESSDSVQDTPTEGVDYGIICLPPTYKNVGEPTRLIIYCHGAAVNYTSLVTRFDNQDLEPDYWLAEGYAVMDIEGNPFDDENEHICMPQAMDSYIAGYKWAIEYFNLCRDGVFIGGRSMGGFNTFNLIRRECPIPVIAACPNVPSGEQFGYFKAARKAFCALHMGFDVPSGFVWSAGPCTTEEVEILSNNWDKYVKCIPLYNMCLDLPSKDVLLEFQKILNGEDRRNTLSQLHAVAKCPVKLFGCYEDEGCPPADTSALYYRMLINSAQIAELRLFHSYKDYTGTGTSAHHYDTQDPALRTTVTTRYGEELTNIPVVYVEMLRFWQRFEQL